MGSPKKPILTPRWLEVDRNLAMNSLSWHFCPVQSNLPSTISPTVLYLLSAPSTPDAVIDKALEKVESGEKVTVADVKDWKAELETERRRNAEWAEQSNGQRKKIRALV